MNDEELCIELRKKIAEKSTEQISELFNEMTEADFINNSNDNMETFCARLNEVSSVIKLLTTVLRL